MRSRKYEEGRRKALEQLGIRSRPEDNQPVSGFLQGVDGIENPGKPGSGPKVSRLDRPTSWGPKFTITPEDVGVGA